MNLFGSFRFVLISDLLSTTISPSQNCDINYVLGLFITFCLLPYGSSCSICWDALSFRSFVFEKSREVGFFKFTGAAIKSQLDGLKL